MARSTHSSPVTSQLLQLNVPAGDSKNDIVWLSDNTTVPK